MNLGKCGDGFIEVKEVDRAESSVAANNVAQRDPTPGAAVSLRPSAACVVDQDATNDGCDQSTLCNRIGHLEPVGLLEPQPGLVDDRRRLKRMARTLLAEGAAGDGTDLLIVPLEEFGELGELGPGTRPCRDRGRSQRGPVIRPLGFVP